jgi:mono/diheme cytochrome c family protein
MIMRILILIPVLLIGCHKNEPGPKAPEPPAAATTITAQIDQGKQLYVDKCSKCHGDAGQGVPDKGPPVVGPEAFPQKPRQGAKRDVEFHTAADVFAWASKHMPANAPGSLTTDEYLAIFAFDLTANGIKLEKPLDGPAAQAIVLHP